MTAPLVSRDVDLSDFPFMPIMIAQLQRSRAWLICKKKPQLAFYMLNLWMGAWHGRPAASVENDDLVLADIAGCDEKTWIKVKAEVLRGWVECDDGRLYHSVIAERAMEAWSRKVARRSQTEAARLAREAERLRKAELHRAEVERLSRQTTLPLDGPVTGSVTETATGVVSGSKREGEGEGEGQGQGEGEYTSLRSDAGAGGRSVVDRFFEVYPVHVAEDGVEREIQRKLGEGHALDDILAGAKRYAALNAGKPADKIANPVGWLRDGRWKDGTRSPAKPVVASDTSFVRLIDPAYSPLRERWKTEKGQSPPDRNGGWYFPNEWITEVRAESRVSA